MNFLIRTLQDICLLLDLIVTVLGQRGGKYEFDMTLILCLHTQIAIVNIAKGLFISHVMK